MGVTGLGGWRLRLRGTVGMCREPNQATKTLGNGLIILKTGESREGQAPLLFPECSIVHKHPTLPRGLSLHKVPADT